MEGSIIIEVTRKCNIRCMHCLRGEMVNKDIDFSYIDKLLDQYTSIYSVTFTGGEPSLNVPAINHFLEEVKRRNIHVGSFFMYTNGVKISEEFVVTCLRLYAYCYEKDMCNVTVSNDVYHAEESNYNTELLDGLGFFHRKYTKEATQVEYLLYQGLAMDNFYCKNEVKVSPITTQEEFNDSNDVYLNAEGNIINGCDWSYENQDDNILCNVEGLTEFYNSLPE